MQTTDIFERLKKGETILPSDPQAYRMLEESYSTKKLLVQMNNATEPKEIRDLLRQITGSKLTKALTYLLLCTSITASIQKLVKTYLSISIALFWTWEVSPLMMGYF
jgi:hypothetical protein